MPRQVPHFKTQVSVKNHPKMVAVYADNDLFAMWTRLGIEAVARFADRTGDTFVISDREIAALSGRNRSDSGRRALLKLAAISPITVEKHGDTWHIHFPNFAKKQGFKSGNGTHKSTHEKYTNGNQESPPSTSTSTSTSTSKPPVTPPRKKTPLPNPIPLDLLAEFKSMAVEAGISPDELVTALRDYADSSGQRYASWPAAVRIAIRSGYGWVPKPTSGPSASTPTYADRNANATKAAARNVALKVTGKAT